MSTSIAPIILCIRVSSYRELFMVSRAPAFLSAEGFRGEEVGCKGKHGGGNGPAYSHCSEFSVILGDRGLLFNGHLPDNLNQYNCSGIQAES
jgi:hypothetical protein